jgi:hypothetical protein
MTKRNRTVLFYSFLFLFLLVSPLAVLYSQGYRLNFNPEPGGRIIVKTGGFFVNAEPRQVEIYLDGKFEKRTDFIFGSNLIKNLLPKKYKIEVKKDGYFTWTKTLEVKEKEVTEAKSVVLFPQKPVFSPLGENEINPFLPEKKATTTVPKNILAYQAINNDIYYLDATGSVFLANSSFLPRKKINENLFSLEPGLKYNLKVSPDAKKIVLTSNHEIWLIFTQDIAEQPQRKAGQTLFLNRFSEKIGDIFWLNPNYLVFSAGNKIKILEIDDRDQINIYQIGEFTNPTIKFSPAENKLYILSENKVYSSGNLLP